VLVVRLFKGPDLDPLVTRNCSRFTASDQQ